MGHDHRDLVLGVTTTTLGLTADTITSQTSVVRIGEINTLVGSSVFSNLSLTVLGVPTLSLGVNAQVGANFAAYDLLGLKVTLNEQQASSNGSSFQSLVTNALQINCSDFLTGGRTVTGDVIIGQSRASTDFSPLDPLPEPAIWLQLITGFGLTGMVVRKRRGHGRCRRNCRRARPRLRTTASQNFGRSNQLA
jgi:hypothetical protein